jgi:endonuclease/exonuclease/phosphatase family metal-dependent hydrolase
MELDDEDEAEGPVEVLAATWNVHSFVMCRTGQIAAEAVRAGIEVLLLQECSAACVAAQFRKPEWQAAYAGAPGDWMGNAVCVRGRARLGAWRKAQLDVERSALLASVAVAGRRLLVCCTHLDHQSEERRVRQLEALLDELQRESDSALGRGRVLLGGDLNALTRLDYSDARWAELQVRYLSIVFLFVCL